MLTLPIICTEGIGDSLLTLSKMPIRFLGAFGFRFELFYDAASKEPPAARKILMPLFTSIKYVTYNEGPPSTYQRKLFKKLTSLQQRWERLWPVPLVGAPAQRQHQGPARILIQTHLDGHHGWKGASAKIWKIDNWIVLISKLQKSGYDVSIMEWDKESSEHILREIPGTLNLACSKSNFKDICQAISQFDLLISIDSWSKYVAEWHKLRQVIIVPNLRQGYIHTFSTLTADWIARWWFHGLMHNPRVKVLGLELEQNTYEFSIETLDDLSVDQVFSEVVLKLTGENPR